MAEQITDFLQGLTPYQIREYRRRLQEMDQALRDEIKGKQTEKENHMLQKEVTELREKIAIKRGLPGVLAEWLRGETEDDIEKDADKLIRFIKPGTALLDISRMTPAEIRANADDLFEQVRKKMGVK
jgi:hypothetical protein